MSIPKPSYTQTPNVLFDEYLRDMREAELKVILAIVRATFGWHVKEAPLSIADLQESTGMSRQGVINGIDKGMERGTIERRADGNSFIYSLSVNDVDSSDSEEHAGSQRNRPAASQRSRPVLVNEVDHLEPESSPVSAALKKDKESIKEISSFAGAKDATELTEQQQWFAAICQAVGWDYHILGAKEKGQVAQLIGILRKGGYTLARVEAFPSWWKKNDWRGQKGQLPTLSQFRQELSKVPAPAAPRQEVNVVYRPWS